MQFLRNLLQRSTSGAAVRSPAPAQAASVPPGACRTNDLAQYADIIGSIEPWRGPSPPGFIIDYLGNRTPKAFLEPWGVNPLFADGAPIVLPLPQVGRGGPGEDFWFESLNWILAAQEARDRFVMMTLGALHGYQAVGSARALLRFNPMPYKLVAVEPVPANIDRIRREMRENGIDPDAQWIIQAVVSDNHEPAFFPVGAPGAGWQNCMASNDKPVRQSYLDTFIKQGRVEEALRNLLLNNSTGLQQKGSDVEGMEAEIKLVSCVTMADLLGPFERVDYVEADMQESEIRAFPPFMDLLKRKVRRIHVATHGKRVHAELHDAFAANGWQVLFSYAPESGHATPWGPLITNDGILTVLNPALER